MNGKLCDGCGHLKTENWPRGCVASVCCDPDKPVLGARRVIHYKRTPGPACFIQRPAWCKNKIKKGEEQNGTV